MNVILREQIIDDKRFPTLFCELKSIVNGRPLSDVSDCKLLRPHRYLQNGDVVLIMDKNIPRNNRPMGRIIQTFL